MIGPVPVQWGGGAGWRGGGVASHIQGLLPQLSRNKVHTHLLADNTAAAQRPEFPDLGPDVEIEAIKRSISEGLKLGLGRIIRLSGRMLKEPDLWLAAPLGQTIRYLGQAANFDQFLSSQSADILHIHQAQNRQFLCQQIVHTHLPVVVTAHSVNVLLQPHPAWLGQMIRANYRRADWFIAVSNFVKEKIISYGADPAHITVINNGVNIHSFTCGSKIAARDKLDLEKESFIVLFSGNLIARKGVGVLIQAFRQLIAEHPAARLILLGDGPEREQLQNLTQELGIARDVDFAGYTPFAEMPLWYQACDVFVMPSWAEGLSMSILEAMSCGKPVITTTPDLGTHDAVIPGKTGLLVEYGNVAQLTKALEQLINQPEFVQKMGKTARCMVEQSFTWELIGRKTAQVYRALLQRRRTLSE
ncbi:MAG: glycosyltransferase [Chloroflexi bacterium]|jgi:glycosyltransferase involved in cell wall biosynthesis|nr:glycosyltransferase [Chloroflexota bacterium]